MTPTLTTMIKSISIKSTAVFHSNVSTALDIFLFNISLFDNIFALKRSFKSSHATDMKCSSVVDFIRLKLFKSILCET